MQVSILRHLRLRGFCERGRLRISSSSAATASSDFSLKSTPTRTKTQTSPFSTTSLQAWEKLAKEELDKSSSSHTLESLRSERVTPEGIAIQPVYYDYLSNDAEMPGIPPFTRGM